MEETLTHPTKSNSRMKARMLSMQTVCSKKIRLTILAKVRFKATKIMSLLTIKMSNNKLSIKTIYIAHSLNKQVADPT